MAILLEDYSPQWKLQFEQLTEVYKKHLDGLVLSIEHVGSTAVPGLCAKPVIDIDIVVESLSQVTQVIPHLVELGYEYLGEVAIPERFVFRQTSKHVPYDGSGRSWQKHHLYCCIKDCAALRNHLLLRDALLMDQSLAFAYAVLKRSLADSTSNMDEYVMGKTSFIAEVLAKGGMSSKEILAIAVQNKTVIPPSEPRK